MQSAECTPPHKFTQSNNSHWPRLCKNTGDGISIIMKHLWHDSTLKRIVINMLNHLGGVRGKRLACLVGHLVLALRQSDNKLWNLVGGL